MDGLRTSYYLFSFSEVVPSHLKQVRTVTKNGYAMATTQRSYYCGGFTDSVSLQNPEAGWGWILEQGFNAICTDFPEELIQYLKEKGRR